MTTPARLWYTVGTLDVTNANALLIKPSDAIRTLVQYRARMDKKFTPKLNNRIEATWTYLGALAWCMEHAPRALDNTTLLWVTEKNDQLPSNQGVALEYLATLLSLAGQCALKAKIDRDKGLSDDCALGLELCAQCCEHAALHAQRHLSNDGKVDGLGAISPNELLERGRLLRLCARQELVDMEHFTGAMHLMRELHAFAGSTQQQAMRVFALCMHTDWQMTLAGRLGQVDELIPHDTARYDQALCAHHLIVNKGHEFKKKLKKDVHMGKFVPPAFIRRVTVAADKSKQHMDTLLAKRAQYLLVTAPMDLGDLDPISTTPAAKRSDQTKHLFENLDPTPLDLARIVSPRVFQDQLHVHVASFATTDARTPESVALPKVSMMTLDEYAYKKIPPAQRQGVAFGMLAERRRQLEERQRLWPSADTQADIANVIATMDRVVLT